MFKKLFSVICIFSLIVTTSVYASVNKPTTSKSTAFGLSSITFSLKGLDGVKYSSKNIFSQNKLTMINIWGTLCNPCIKELPQLNKLNVEMSDKKFGIIGIVGDVTDSDSKEEAKSIILKKRITFANLIPDDKLQSKLLSKISGYPVSIFVDSSGNIVGDVITGSRSKEEYKKAAEKILGSLK